MVLGCTRSRQPKPDPAPEPTSSITGAETEGTPIAPDYQFVSERNVFRPLVVAPKSEGGGSGEGASPSTGSTGRTSSSGQSGPNPSRPPDPTADLAITGITETTDGLRVLVEKVSTGEGVYAGLGDVVFGLTVKGIGRGRVTLAQGDKEYELKLGEKEIATTPAVAQATSSPETQTGSSTSSSSSSSSTPSFGGRMDWRNMSPEERQRAMEERRRWWEGLSESERSRYRSGSGRGSDRGPAHSFGRGPRG